MGENRQPLLNTRRAQQAVHRFVDTEPNVIRQRRSFVLGPITTATVAHLRHCGIDGGIEVDTSSGQALNASK
jgi:hypothetical protein